MKILFVINDIMLEGGTANSFLTILDNIPRVVEQVYILMPERGTLAQFFEKKNISVWVMDYKPVWTDSCFITMEDVIKESNNVKCAYKLAKRLKENNIDIIYTNSGIIDVGAMAAFLAGKKHIWHHREFVHNHFKKKYIFEWKEKWLLKRSAVVVAISKSLRKELIKRYHIKNGIVLYNRFDREKYYIERKDLFLTTEIKCLITGRMYEGKHQLDAVKAIGKLKKVYHISIELYMVGGGEGNYINEIKDEMNAYELQEKIHIMQYEEDMRALRERMDIEISCSQWEAFGRVIIEGMLGGLFIVGANSGATPELIKHGKNGLLYCPGNADDLAEKLFWAYNHRQEAKKIALNGQRWADKLYTDNHFGKDLENILIDAIK